MNYARDIAFGVTGQTLTFVAPEGRPSAVTSVTVFPVGTGDDGASEGAISGSASIESVSTTVDADSGYGQANPRLLYVAATTNFAVGGTYLVMSADGAREWFEVVEIDSGNYLKTRHPLANAYASGDTVVGTKMSATVDSTWVADTSNLTGGTDPGSGYRVRWVYVVGGVTYVHDAYFDLVRYPGGHTITTSDIEAMYPGFKGMLSGYHRQDDGRQLVNEAYQQVRWDLTDLDLDDSAVADRDAMNRATLLRLGVLLAKVRLLQGQGTPDVLDMAERDYGAFVTKAFRGGKVDTHAGSSAAASRAPVVSPFEK